VYLIRANIKLNNEHRKEPISGTVYRPLLYFSNLIIRSGLMDIEDKSFLEMDKFYENILFKIYFYSDLDCEKEFFMGRKFDIAEGSNVIGIGEIIAVIGVAD
jgi:hypothetical protein